MKSDLSAQVAFFLKGETMNDQNWKEDYKKWKSDLRPDQVKLLEEGAQSNSQTLILSDMWLDWKNLAAKRKLNKIAEDSGIEDPWDENVSPCSLKKAQIDEQLLKLVAPIH